LAGWARAASVSIIERFAETLTAHDLDALAALFADGYVNHQLSAAAPPPAGVPSKPATVNFFAARLKGCRISKRLADGKIAEHWGMGDIAGVVARLKG